MQKDLLPAPKTTAEALAFAETLSKSELIPVEYRGRPTNVFACMLWSHSLGIPIVQGLQCITVINGRLSLWGDGLLAVVMASGKVEDFKETVEADAAGNLVATCIVKRQGLATPTVATFSQDDAIKAGLWVKKGPWTQYPKRMLQMRARGFALRNAFPDVLSGMACAEEMQDVEDLPKGDAPDAAPDATPARKMPARKAKKPEPADIVDIVPNEAPEPKAPEPADAAPMIETTAPEEPTAYPTTAEDVLGQIKTAASVAMLSWLYKTIPAELRSDQTLIDAMSARKAELEAKEAQ